MSINIPVTAVSLAFKEYTKEHNLAASKVVTALLKECDAKALTGIVPMSYNSKQYGIALKSEGKAALDRLYSKCAYPKHTIVTELIRNYLIEQGVDV